MLNEGAGIFSLLVGESAMLVFFYVNILNSLNVRLIYRSGLSIPLSVFGLLGTVGTTWQEAAFSFVLSFSLMHT